MHLFDGIYPSPHYTNTNKYQQRSLPTIIFGADIQTEVNNYYCSENPVCVV